MSGFRHDLRYALRALRRTPVFTGVAILTLALGIGANTAIFTLIDTLMLRALPVRDPGQLVELLSRYPGEPETNGFSLAVYERFRDQNHVFSDLVGYSPARFQVSGERVDAETLDGAYVTGSLFPALGVRPALGRLLGVDDDRAGAATAAVISWAYWRRAFNFDPGVVGTPMRIDRTAVTIVGVLPRELVGLDVGTKPDVWVPISARPVPPGRNLRDQFGVGLLARLKPDVSIAQARADMAVLNRARVEELAQISTNPVWRQATLGVEPAAAGFSTLNRHYGKPLVALMLLVALLLLVACTNLASLLLARSAARQREMAIRNAVGAGRFRLVRQALTESLLLSAAGAIPGVALAYVGAGALARIVTSGPIIGVPGRITIDIQPDGRLLLFTLLMTTATGVIFGLAPAWNAFAFTPASAIRTTIGETRSHRAFGQFLVVAQVALSVVLLSAAALFVDHLSGLRNVGLGFDKRSLLLVRLDPRDSGYDRAQLTALYEQLLARLHAIPGVRSASLSGVTPVEGPGAARFASVEGFRERPQDRRYLSLNWIGPRYFETLGTPWITGRDFEFADAARPRVAIVNQSMARHYFGGDAGALGKHITFDGDTTPYEIVGVAGDARYLNLYRSPPTVYLNAFQDGSTASQFSLRTSVPPEQVAGDVRRAVADLLKTVKVARVRTMTEQVDASIVPERLIATLSGVFGVLGTLLAAVGLYGLLSYSVARRTSEIGVRIALGATRGHVIGMVLKRAVTLAAAGFAIGAPVALWSRRFAVGMLEGLSADSAAPIVLAIAALMTVALAAAYVPARRAAGVDPVEALRQS